MTTPVFIIDCPWCKAKVGAVETGRAVHKGVNDEAGEPFSERIVVGLCPSCGSPLVGESHQLDFQRYGSDEDRWSDIVRVYPKPPRTFISYRIPRVVKESLAEADRSLQANANTAACVMLGRALEAVCRNILDSTTSMTAPASSPPTPQRKVMLAEGIKQLKEKGVIDERLYDWSQQLHAFRNIAAHPEDITISREDAEDLQSFVYAIVEYIYDLTDRYKEFKERIAKKAKKK